ncbi:DUF5996 family protein [Sphingosinicella terrae]|uniref:DUF5996 family protein n=1 Tax=Sphingosinicella terrae TaxID=2172047 RepID=UPI000E0D3FEA|nr:DUF5996 family protein [Sphingosinicella terrae]
MTGSESSWPPLSAAQDGATIATLHRFSQIVGKVPTALLPWRNHGWHLTLHLTPRGLRTEPIHDASGTFELALDLIDHRLELVQSSGRHEIPLRAMSVADFHAKVMEMLAQAGHSIRIHGAPNELPDATPFDRDSEIRPYEPASAGRLHAALLSADRVFRLFRSGFLGKVSPVHFFWGSFDLAVTRFSGRPAPLHPGGIPHLPDAVTREAYSHEVSSAGFWPGGAGAPGEPFFYSYAYPAPAGFAEAEVAPDQARFEPELGEFVLDYAAVRSAADPDAALLDFLRSSYAAAADIGEWDRDALECPMGQPSLPREVGP